MNHVNFEQRLGVIKSVLKDECNLEATKITPVEYDPECPFAYNNFIYHLTVFQTSPPPQRLQPGIVAIPNNATEIIMRLSNATAMGMNNHNRVENEVASMHLARQALGKSSDLVPQIYGWSSALNGQGWILMQYMPGIALDQGFTSLSLTDRASVLEQIALVVYALQQVTLPKTITGLGGLTFDQDGEIVSAQMTIVSDGPFESSEEYYRAILLAQLYDAEQSSVLKGWRENDIRERLEKFIHGGLGRALKESIGDEENRELRRVLVHGDLTPNNLLFDPKTLRLTAIIDFDWAHIAGIADEFCRSFGSVMDCQFSGPYNDDAEQLMIRNAFLKGFPDPLPESTSWATAKVWDEKLLQVGAQRPATAQGISLLSGLYWLSEQIAPWILVNETVMKRHSREKLEQIRESTALGIGKYLDTFE